MEARSTEKVDEREYLQLLAQLVAFNKTHQTDDPETQMARDNLVNKVRASRDALQAIHPTLNLESLEKKMLAKMAGVSEVKEVAVEAVVEKVVEVEDEIINPYVQQSQPLVRRPLKDLFTRQVPGKLSQELANQLLDGIKFLLRNYATTYSRHGARINDLIKLLSDNFILNYRLIRKVRYPEVADNIIELLAPEDSKLRSAPNQSWYAYTIGAFFSDAMPALLDQCLAMYQCQTYDCLEMATLLKKFPLPKNATSPEKTATTAKSMNKSN